MSLKFKHGNEGGDTPKKAPEPENNNGFEAYPSPANVRTVTFVEKAGVEETLFYSDLYSIQFDRKQATLTLLFQHRDVTITGGNLDELNELFKSQEVKNICTTNERYESLVNGRFRIDIEIKKDAN